MERYIAHSWGKLEKVNIEKETEKSYWIKGSRHQKHNSYSNLFKTRSEAKDFIIKEQLKKIEATKRQVVYLENELEKIKQL